MATQNISAIQGYIEKYDANLIYQMLNGLDFIQDLAPGLRRNVRTEVSLPKMTVAAGVRPLNTDVETAKGGRTWTRRKLTPRYGMKIFKVILQEARESFMSEQLAPNAKREPFAAWQWAREFEKVAEEINNNFYLSKHHGDPEIFDALAVYDPADLVYFETPGKGLVIYECVTLTTAGQSPTTHPAKWTDVDNKVVFDGPGTIIATEIAATNLAAFAGGSYTETTAYAAYKAQFDNIPEAKKAKGLVAYASYDSVRDLAENVNSAFGSGKGIANSDIEDGKPFLMRNTGGRLMVKPCTWMGTSRRIIMTRPKNLVCGIDAGSDMNTVGKVVETLHGYNAIMTYMLTFNFADLEELFVNNQA